MFEKLLSKLDLSIQEGIKHARDTNFFENGTTGRGVFPAINLLENEGDMVLTTELPGIKKEELVLEFREDVLRLSGFRNIERDKDSSYHRAERKGLKFDRSLKLPFRIEGSQIQAEYKNGLLMVILPRAESDKPKQITIK